MQFDLFQITNWNRVFRSYTRPHRSIPEFRVLLLDRTWFKYHECMFKAASSVPFDLFILEIMFLFFKNTVKILKFRYTFYHVRIN